MKKVNHKCLTSLLLDVYGVEDPKSFVEFEDQVMMEAYGFDWRKMIESDCVAELMKMYQELAKKDDLDN